MASTTRRGEAEQVQKKSMKQLETSSSELQSEVFGYLLVPAHLKQNKEPLNLAPNYFLEEATAHYGHSRQRIPGLWYSNPSPAPVSLFLNVCTAAATLTDSRYSHGLHTHLWKGCIRV